MSTFKTHILAGISMGTVATCCMASLGMHFNNILCYALPMFSSIVGALSPDMDIKSHSSRIMYLIYYVLSLYLYYIGHLDFAFYVLLFAIIPQFFKHRGFIHTWVFNFLSSCLIFYIIYQCSGNLIYAMIISFSYFIGFWSHLLLDNL